jgi:dipeptidase E
LIHYRPVSEVWYDERMNLLLVSSSYCADGGYLDHARDEVKQFLDSCPPGRVLFVPYAAFDLDGYADIAEKFFGDLGYDFASIHRAEDARAAALAPDVKAIFIGGGNTFRLLKALQDRGLLDVIRQKVADGTGYMGTSAGVNVACPTIRTTNDMPIVEPTGLDALGLVDFQINAHFISGALAPGHRGETREQRIAEFHEENDAPVIGLPEASWIRVQGDETVLGGGAEAVVFRRGADHLSWGVGSELPRP